MQALRLVTLPDKASPFREDGVVNWIGNARLRE